jgi:hypothetical protein
MAHGGHAAPQKRGRLRTKRTLHGVAYLIVGLVHCHEIIPTVPLALPAEVYPNDGLVLLRERDCHRFGPTVKRHSRRACVLSRAFFKCQPGCQAVTVAPTDTHQVFIRMPPTVQVSITIIM